MKRISIKYQNKIMQPFSLQRKHKILDVSKREKVEFSWKFSYFQTRRKSLKKPKLKMRISFYVEIYDEFWNNEIIKFHVMKTKLNACWVVIMSVSNLMVLHLMNNMIHNAIPENERSLRAIVFDMRIVMMLLMWRERWRDEMEVENKWVEKGGWWW